MRITAQSAPTVDKVPEEKESLVKIETSVPSEPKAPIAKGDYRPKQTVQQATTTVQKSAGQDETANHNETKSCTFRFHVLQLATIALLLLSIGGIIGGLIANALDKDDDDNVSMSTDEDNVSKPTDEGRDDEFTEPPSPTKDDPTSFSAVLRFPPNGDWKSLDSPTRCRTLALSGDGTILATASGKREIQVYQKQGESSDWSPIGNLIDTGSSVYPLVLVLSSKGDILAAGGYGSGIKAYSLVGDGVSASWEQLGNELDHHRRSLAISPDGSAIALCGEDRYVSVYDYKDSHWMMRKKRSEIFCDDDASLALSEMGEFLVIGDENEGDNGQISLFKYEGDDGGRLVEDGIIYGKNRFASFGSTVKVSTKNGLIVAVASRRYQGSYGLAQVFLYKNDKNNNENANASWQQLGQDLFGKIDGAQYGWTIDLSEDGLVIAIGSGERPVANVFYLDGDEWKAPPGQKNLAIPKLDYEYGDVNSISLSSDGTKVAFCGQNGAAMAFHYNNDL